MAAATGIDDINVDAGTLLIEAADIARGRGHSPDEQARLLILRRSVLPAFEDPVTLAVNAAWPIVESSGRSNIRLLIVATESGVDFAKPLSSYVHEHLRLPSNCRHLEVKHACYAGTAALRLACGWLRDNPESKALVICTDMARRLFEDPAEAAEGVGATAMLVSAEPRVMTLEKPAGVAAREIYDVIRPTPTQETIHASLSLAAYLDLLEEAWPDYQKQPGALALDAFDALLFHTPLIPLVRQAHALLREVAEADKAGTVGDFVRRVLPSTRFSQQTGNTYSGCLYVVLAALAEATTAQQRVGLFSYGSGSCAEFFHGVMQPTASSTVKPHGIDERLQARMPVDFPTYEKLVVTTEESMTHQHHIPKRDLVKGLWERAYEGKHRLVLNAVEHHHRSYRWS